MSETYDIKHAQGSTERPLVTFALFAYNQEKYIREAVEGAFSQTYEPLEIILSDDCSTDRTYEIMQEMAREYRGPHRVRTVKNATNLGVLGHVLLRGREAKGSVVVAAAGDDVSLPERAAKLYEAIGGKETIAAAYSRAHIIDEDGRIVCQDVVRPLNSRLPTLYIRPEPIESRIIQGCSAAYRKTLFEVEVESPACILYEDVLFSFLVNLRDMDVSFISEALILYRYHSGAIVNRPLEHRAVHLADEEENMLNAVIRTKMRIECFRKIAFGYETRLDKNAIARDLRDCDVVLLWSSWKFYQRLVSLFIDILFNGARTAKWQAARLFGKYPYYQPKTLVARFQTSRYSRDP